MPQSSSDSTSPENAALDAVERAVWPDLLLFGIGVAMAGWYGWDTAGLVWGLWLASLVVGYAIIVTHIVRQTRHGLTIPAGIGMLLFFTIHFGGFHWGHSMFLDMFFPIEGSGSMRSGSPGLAQYVEVVQRAWWFVPLAFLAERDAFRADAVVLGSRRSRGGPGNGRMSPYHNVVRLHLLIFFFAFAACVGLPAVLIYLVVYAVYFFPWSSLRSLYQRSYGGASKL